MSYGDQCAAEDVWCTAPMRFSNPGQHFRRDRAGVFGGADLQPYTDAGDAARRGSADPARTHRGAAFTLANYTVRDRPDLTVKGRAVRRPLAARRRRGAFVRGRPEPSVWTPPRGKRWKSSPRIGSQAAGGASPTRTRRLEGPRSRGAGGRRDDVRNHRRTLNRDFRISVTAAGGETLTENNHSESVRFDAPPEFFVELDTNLADDGVLRGSTVRAAAVVSNLGASASPAASLVFYESHTPTADSGTVVHLVGSGDIPSLRPRTKRSFSRGLNTDFVGWRTFHACVDPGDGTPPDPLAPGPDDACSSRGSCRWTISASGSP